MQVGFSEPCYCGSPDCKRCYPFTWDEPPPEFCDDCDHFDDCPTAGNPSKKCQRYEYFQSLIESQKED